MDKKDYTIINNAKNTIPEFGGYRTKRVDGLIPFNKRSVIIM